METHITIFLSLIIFAVTMGIIGLWKRIPLLLFIGGAVITFWAISTESIIMGSIPITNSTVIQTVVQSNITNYHYIVESGSTNSPTGNYSGAAFARAIHASTSASLLVGDNLQCIEYKLQKVGNPPVSRNLAFGIFTLDKSTVQTFGVLNVTNISTTPAYYPICVPEGQERIIQTADKIGFVWEESGADASNHIRAFIDTSNPFDGTTTRRTAIPFGTAGWVATPADDHSARLYDFEVTYATIQDFDTTVGQDVLPFDQYPKILFGLIGSILMISGALIWKYEEN